MKARVNRALFWLVISVFLTGYTHAVYAANSQDEAQQRERIERLRKGVVKVLTTKPGDIRETGAGIMIGEQRGKIYFLTAYHVVEDATSILVESYGNRGVFHKATIFADRYDPDHDIAVLVVPGLRELSESVEQLYEVDLDEVVSNDSIIIGHSGDNEWELVFTEIFSRNSTGLLLERGSVQRAHSGGPLLDKYGNLIGIVIGEDEAEYGNVVRIDTALSILDRWGVPYKVRFRVDFCSVFNKLQESATRDFNDAKGARWERSGGDDTFWELVDKSFDITGEGRAMLVRDWRVGGSYDVSDNPAVYVANFGSQRDEIEADRVWRELGQKIDNCLPDEEVYRDGEYCFRASYRESWLDDPVMFISYRDFRDIELYMFQGYDTPRNGKYSICEVRPSGGYVLHSDRAWEK